MTIKMTNMGLEPMPNNSLETKPCFEVWHSLTLQKNFEQFCHNCPVLNRVGEHTHTSTHALHSLQIKKNGKYFASHNKKIFFKVTTFETTCENKTTFKNVKASI